MESSRSVNEFDEKTRVTQVSQEPPTDHVGANDCVVVIYTKEPTLLGKRIVLDQSTMRIGRGTDNHIVLDGSLYAINAALAFCAPRVPVEPNGDGGV